MWTSQPKKFGALHLTFLFLIVIRMGISIFFGYHCQGEKNKKKRDLILSATGIFLVLFEIAKIIFVVVIHQADFSLLPLQLCSTALLILPLPYFLPDGRFKDCVYGYLAFVRTTAGISYFVNPTTLITPRYIFNCLHSGIYHLVIISSGTFLFISMERYRKKGISYYLKSFPLFVSFSLVAILANTIAIKLDPNTNLDFFFLMPNGPATIPLLDTWIKPRVPFVCYYLIYLACFFMRNFVPFGVFHRLNFIVEQAQKKNAGNNIQKADS